METEPLPIERAAHDTDSNERCHDANDGRGQGMPCETQYK
jgi:hypothetical protein